MPGQNLKPIETRYKGYRFRSRLEARWAVFFDALGIEWEYEKEGYDLGHGVWYLPDFYVLTWDKFAEVKPRTKIKFDDFRKWGLLVQRSGKPVLVIYGNPWPGEYVIVPFIPAYSSDNEKTKVTIPPKDWNQTCFAYSEHTKTTFLVLVGNEKLEKQEEPPLQNLVPLTQEWYTYDETPMWILTKDDLEEIQNPLTSYQGIHAIIGSVDKLDGDLTLDRAYLKARQARFERGETPE